MHWDSALEAAEQFGDAAKTLSLHAHALYKVALKNVVAESTRKVEAGCALLKEAHALVKEALRLDALSGRQLGHRIADGLLKPIWTSLLDHGNALLDQVARLCHIVLVVCLFGWLVGAGGSWTVM